MTRREDIFSDDSVEIMIDTFHDARRAYAFAVNPFGIQWDALWTEGSIGTGAAGDFSGFDNSFDTVWRSEGRLTSHGYLALIAIPFKSLRFPNTEAEWGIILNRSIPRTNENIFWPRISNRIQGRFNQAATATGLERISPARNVQLIPYGLFRSFRDIDQRDPESPFLREPRLQTRRRLDAKFILPRPLCARCHGQSRLQPGRIRPAPDHRQPALRSLLSREAAVLPREQQLLHDARSTWSSPAASNIPSTASASPAKSGPWAVGVLASDDRAPGEALPPSDPHNGERATFAIARVSRDILEQSTIGAIFTDREFGGGYNRVGGVDANIKLNQNWRVQGAAVTSSTLNVDGSHSAGPGYKVDLERAGRQLNLQALYLDYSPGS